MKLIKPSFEILDQQCGLEGIYKQIEIAGRTCYKSEDKITEDSAKGFVERMIKSGHGAMLEHGTVYLKFETITLCPICKKGIIKEMLTNEEIEWLNNYHQTVYEKLSPDLNEEEKVWLQEATASL